VVYGPRGLRQRVSIEQQRSRRRVMNKLVARFADGRLIKGSTLDFAPDKEVFHMTMGTLPAQTIPMPIHTKHLKALFFVKDLDGDPQHVERRAFDCPPPPGQRRVMAAFKDGEVLVGTTPGYQPGLPGLYLIPADPESNIERCYVIASATEQISFL
jgi:hypothetical protein